MALALLFPGQGAQFPGMGAKITGRGREALEHFDSVRPGTLRQCLGGSPEELALTINTQPCLFAVEVASALSHDEAPDYAAGFSLGEVAALTWAGAFTLEDGFRAVIKRAELMQKAAEKNPGAMFAALKLSDETVESVASSVGAWPVNYNSPGQVVCAMPEEKAEAFAEAISAAGGRAMRLNVSGAFHSPFMEEAAKSFGDYLSEVEIRKPRVPVYSDALGSLYGDEIKDTLAKQISSPVRWTQIVRDLASRGVDRVVETGPGSVLSGLVKRTEKSISATSLEV